MGALNLLVTGAGGFLGRAVVQEALARGHHVRGLVRRGTAPDGAETICGDLAEAGDWLAPALEGVDAVIHIAASMSGDVRLHARDTLRATEMLGRACSQAAVQRFVLVSSIAVLSSDPALEGEVMNEQTPLLDPETPGRDAYARAKRQQEDIVTALAIPETWIVRPGAIYGPGRSWNANIGPALGPLLLRVGSRGDVPLISRQSCARALVCAAETPVRGAVEALTLVDTPLPERGVFVRAHQAGGWPRVVVPVNWQMWHGLSRLIGRWTGSGWLTPATVRARLMPVRYSSEAARARLRWVPESDWQGALRRAMETAP